MPAAERREESSFVYKAADLWPYLFHASTDEEDRMKKFESLKKTRDFGTVYRQGKSCGSRLFVMYVLRGQDHGSRVGVSVSRKVGNSVIRHRIKRRVKESFRRNLDAWEDGCDYVIVVRKEAGDKDYRQIESALRHLGRHHGVYMDSGFAG